ncbi:hypothetical protein INT43_007471 [Umbelopsis isabellina]|uniref:Cyclin N-terminal domain-containing protein n=1 Tax=Mortierella isabellina TaxID=91625 RepID=A0A8H7UGU8_MORIS|nr:hypothetical protein INT43_007471 [Umbelopsis isabellina]
MNEQDRHLDKSVRRLLRSPISDDMIDHVTSKAISVIPCPLPSPPAEDSGYFGKEDKIYSDPLSSDQPASASSYNLRNSQIAESMSEAPPPPLRPGQVQVPPLRDFIANLVKRSRLQTGTFLSTLVYLERLRLKLGSVAQGMPCTCHRIFLATLIVTAKYVNDTSPKNRHWARYSSVFSVAEVNLMEKQLLVLLDFHLSITIDDLLNDIQYFLPEYRGYISPNQRASYAGLPSQPTQAVSHPNRYSMPISLEESNSVRNFLAEANEYLSHGMQEVGSAKLTDSAYSSDDYNEDVQFEPQHRLKAELVAPPPASYRPERPVNKLSYDESSLYFNSNNPYRNKNELDRRQYLSSRSPNTYAPHPLPTAINHFVHIRL